MKLCPRKGQMCPLEGFQGPQGLEATAAGNAGPLVWYPRVYRAGTTVVWSAKTAACSSSDGKEAYSCSGLGGPVLGAYNTTRTTPEPVF